jgi:hypothetical protein
MREDLSNSKKDPHSVHLLVKRETPRSSDKIFPAKCLCGTPPIFSHEVESFLDRDNNLPSVFSTLLAS